MTPKHRRPTRTDRLLLWAKDRLTLRRRPQPVLETADTISVFSWGMEVQA